MRTRQTVRSLWYGMVAAAAFLVPVYAGASMEAEALVLMDIPVVVTPTLTAKRSDQAPASVTVVTEKEIRESGVRTLFDLLNHVNGIKTYTSPYSREITAMRGVFNNHDIKFKLLINGHPFFEPLWNSFDYYMINVQNIKQVEIVRGPGSALYGSGAFAGTINIITLSPEEINGLEVDARLGSFNSKDGNVSYGKAVGPYRFSLSASKYETDGPGLKLERDYIGNMPFTQTPGTMKEDRWRNEVMACFGYKDYTVNGSFSSYEKRMPVSEMGALTADGETDRLDFGYVEAQGPLYISDQMQLNGKFSYDSFVYNSKGEFMPDWFTLGADVNGDGIFEIWPDGAHADFGYRSEQYRGELKLNYRVSSKNELLWGVFCENIRTYDIYIKAESDPLYFTKTGSMVDYSATTNWNKPASRQIAGSFIQDEWFFAPQWYLILGGRYDQYNDVGSFVNPRCGLVREFDNGNGNVKLLYNEASRAPSFAELYNQNNPAAVGNPYLKPEKLDAAELTLSHIAAGRFKSDIAVYIMRAENLINLSIDRDLTKPLAPLYWVNGSKTRHWGVECTEKYQFTRNDYVFAGYSYTDSRDDATGDPLALVPEHQIVGGFNVLFWNTLNCNVTLDYTGKMTRENGDIRPSVPATTVTDIALRYALRYNIDLYASAYNVFDEKLVAPVPLTFLPGTDIPRPGTTYAAGVTVRF